MNMIGVKNTNDIQLLSAVGGYQVTSSLVTKSNEVGYTLSLYNMSDPVEE